MTSFRSAAHRWVLTFLMLASALVAQTFNRHETYPNFENPRACTVFSSRSDNVTVSGEILQSLTGYVGVGDNGKGAGEIAGVRAHIQDQNASTQESYHVVFRRANRAGDPDASNNGVVFQSGALTTPRGSATLTSWTVTHTFAAAVLVPLTAVWFYGFLLPQALSWPNDGFSVWFAHDTLGSLGDNPRANAPGTGYDVRGGQTFVPREKGTFGISLLTAAVVATLVLAAINPFNVRQQPRGDLNYGRGGLFPDVDSFNNSGRRDDLAVRLFAGAAPGGLAVFCLGSALAASPLRLPGVRGSFWLDPFAVLFLPGLALDASGQAVQRFALPPAVRRQLAGRFLVWISAIWVAASLQTFGFADAGQWQAH